MITLIQSNKPCLVKKHIHVHLGIPKLSWQNGPWINQLGVFWSLKGKHINLLYTYIKSSVLFSIQRCGFDCESWNFATNKHLVGSLQNYHLTQSLRWTVGTSINTFKHAVFLTQGLNLLSLLCLKFKIIQEKSKNATRFRKVTTCWGSERVRIQSILLVIAW